MSKIIIGHNNYENFKAPKISNMVLTRLISIVSKPIIIVVVVIDVVFVKKKLGPKKCWLKKIHVQKTLCQNNFG